MNANGRQSEKRFAFIRVHWRLMPLRADHVEPGGEDSRMRAILSADIVTTRHRRIYVDCCPCARMSDSLCMRAGVGPRLIRARLLRWARGLGATCRPGALPSEGW